jgi:hypothetical protein
VMFLVSVTGLAVRGVGEIGAARRIRIRGASRQSGEG